MCAKYFEYLERHRRFVLEEADKLHVTDRGIKHDLSKFEPDEFDAYAQYFYGGHERGNVPPDVQAAFDYAWLMHQKRNDHHWQYWVLREDSGLMTPLPMPAMAVREMVADWRGAGRAITGTDNTVQWYLTNRHKMVLHDRTQMFVDYLLGLSETGEQD